jgi:hypothetical protein
MICNHHEHLIGEKTRGQQSRSTTNLHNDCKKSKKYWNMWINKTVFSLFRNLVFTWKSPRFSKIVRERFHENKSWHKIVVIGFSEGKNLNYFVKAWKAPTS